VNKFSSLPIKGNSRGAPYLACRNSARKIMSPNKPYAVASPPDIVTRLRETIESNQTTRLLLDQSLSMLTDAIKLHLDHQDAHLRGLIADLEGRRPK
jgi:hypothetical protein